MHTEDIKKQSPTSEIARTQARTQTHTQGYSVQLIFHERTLIRSTPETLCFHRRPEVWQRSSNEYNSSSRGSGGTVMQEKVEYFGISLNEAPATPASTLYLSNDVRLLGHQGNQQKTGAEIAKKAQFPWLAGLCNAVQHA